MRYPTGLHKGSIFTTGKMEDFHEGKTEEIFTDLYNAGTGVHILAHK
jgi:hypothetical protein